MEKIALCHDKVKTKGSRVFTLRAKIIFICKKIVVYFVYKVNRNS